MHRILLCFCTLFFALMLDSHAAHAQTAPTPMRLLVAPYENGAAAQSLSALSLGIPAALAERFEDDPSLAVIDGPLVLTKDSANLVDQHGKGFDLAAANALALRLGATHFLTGRYTGQVWKWTLESVLYAAKPEGPALVGKGIVTGDLNEPVPTPSGRTALVQSTKRLHAMLRDTVAKAFADAGHPLSADMIKAIETPSTGDSYAFLKLSRAYVRYFMDVQDASGDTAIGIAEYAVRVDPKFAEAQRFYATLLLADDQPKKARIHFEFGVEARPKDARSLIALGRLEIGEKNADIARGYLARAIEARPKDPEPRYWLGRAYLDLADKAAATDAFSAARDIDPGRLDARRELVKLFSAAKRYAAAATELDAVVRLAPDDADARFLLAASRRAAGDRTSAMTAYRDATAAFPKEARFHKFLGDLLAEAGREPEATGEYALAAALAPGDARAKALAAGSTSPLIGGRSLTDAVTEANDVAVQMESHRALFQDALNDAVYDLQLNKDKGCLDGHASSSALLAREEGKTHAVLGGRLTDLAAGVKTALGDGEGASLTTDESENAKQALADIAKAERDVREMRGQFQKLFVPLYTAYKCETYDGPITPATADDVRKRMLDREVKLPEVKPPLYQMPFTPQIPIEVGRIVRFTVNNKDGKRDYVLTLDGGETGTVPAGTTLSFTSRIGLHRLCLVPKGASCEKDRDERLIYLHDGWTIRVRPAT